MSDYDNTPAPIGWLERLDKRFMDHLELEREHHQQIREELARLTAKMGAAEQERHENQQLLRSMDRRLSQLDGMFKLIQIFAGVATIVAGIAAWVGLSK